MFLILIGFLAGVATVLSPCILPILPIMLSGAVGGHRRPYGILVGFVLSFAIFTVFATWLVKSIGLDLDLLRYIAAGILVLMGVTLFFPKLQYKLNSLIKLPQSDTQGGNGFGGGFLTGSTLGLVWAPCAGPILAAVITLAATSQAGILSFLIILSYALGTGVVMLIIILASRHVLEKVKGLYRYLETIHKAFGILIIIAGLGIATGYDRKVQSYLVEITPEGWTSFLQSFEENESVLEAIDNLNNKEVSMEVSENEMVLAPDLRDIEAWINSQPLSLADLRGKVVLIDFWTYSCINCVRTLPYLKDWHAKYQDDGLVIIGVHAPEFAFERDPDNVKQAVLDHGLEYPIALDNEFSTWRAYNNRYWPAKYFIDRNGYLRHYHFGEGEYEESEQVIRTLLSEGGDMPTDEIKVSENNNYDRRQSPETYLGYSRAEYFVNSYQRKNKQSFNYQLVDNLDSLEWSLGGDWTINDQSIVSDSNSSVLKINFNSKDVFLVIGSDKKEIIGLKLNGQDLNDGNRGQDVLGSQLTVEGYNLYNLISSDKFIEGGILEITVPSEVELYAFTFGS